VDIMRGPAVCQDHAPFDGIPEPTVGLIVPMT
jgi:hypothetical protein